MAHAGATAISTLPSVAEGIKLTQPCAPYEFRSCEACRLSKAHCIISKSSDQEIPSEKPCLLLGYALIPMAEATMVINGSVTSSVTTVASTGYGHIVSNMRR